MNDKQAIALILIGCIAFVVAVAVVADHPVVYKSFLSWMGEF